MSKEIEDLTTQVTRIKTVAGSAVTLISGLAAEILRLKDDPVALQALAASLDADATTLADAVLQNTPTPPVP